MSRNLQSNKNLRGGMLLIHRSRIIAYASISRLFKREDFRYVLLAFSILSNSQRKKVGLLIFLSVAINFLDLAGIALIGVISSIAINGLTSRAQNPTILKLLEILNIDKVQFEIQIATIVAAVVILFIVKTLVSMYVNRRILFFLSNHSASLSLNLIEQLFNQSLVFIKKRGIQESIYALTSGMSQIALGVIGGIAKVLSDFALLMILVIGLSIVDPVSTVIIVLLYGIATVIIQNKSLNSVRYLSNQIVKESISLNKRVSEFILGYRELFIKGKLKSYSDRIGTIRLAMALKEAKVTFLATLNKYIMEIILVLSVCLLILVQLKVSTATRTIAVTSIFLAASARIMPAIVRLQQNIIQINRSIESSRISFELIEEMKFNANLESSIRTINKSGNIKIESDEKVDSLIQVQNLKFGYQFDDTIIEDLTFNIQEGEFFGIVGPSGSGKSTLIDLLIGIHRPISGRITIAGFSPLELIAKQGDFIGYVPQDSIIIEGSVIENLLFGLSDFTPDDATIESAIKVADLDSLFSQKGINLKNFQIREFGSNLSGGQRQRIGIARALISKPKVLILDEATSALDGISENLIINNLRDVEPKMTIISVAHRLSSLLEANKILMLNHGRVEALGSFAELRINSKTFDLQAKSMGL